MRYNEPGTQLSVTTIVRMMKKVFNLRMETRFVKNRTMCIMILSVVNLIVGISETISAVAIALEMAVKIYSCILWKYKKIYLKQKNYETYYSGEGKQIDFKTIWWDSIPILANVWSSRYTFQYINIEISQNFDIPIFNHSNISILPIMQLSCLFRTISSQ